MVSNFNELVSDKRLAKNYKDSFPLIEKNIEEVYLQCGIEEYKILTPYYFKDFSWGDFFKYRKYKDITNFSPNNELLVSTQLNESYFQGDLYFLPKYNSFPVSYIGFPENAQNLNGNFRYELQKLGKIIEAKIHLEYNMGLKTKLAEYVKKEKIDLSKKFIELYVTQNLIKRGDEQLPQIENDCLATETALLGKDFFEKVILLTKEKT